MSPNRKTQISMGSRLRQAASRAFKGIGRRGKKSCLRNQLPFHNGIWGHQGQFATGGRLCLDRDAATTGRLIVDAVRYAIEVQAAMLERNAGVTIERPIEFRIGIHTGDVVEESDGDLMGDGVNIAAGLEGVVTAVRTLPASTDRS